MSSIARELADRLHAAVVASPQSGPTVELAVGNRPGVAAALADRGADVLATDRHEREVPDTVSFVVDDLTDPDETHFEGASLVYARNLPAELQGPARDLAVSVGAPLFFTTLGAEEPVISVEREPLAGECVRETLFRAVGVPN